ncbi:GTP-binding protein [Staphylococcus pseudintermedius]|nr:GTP-binding protein [Staphylococcus pseudintermedius]
MEDKNQSYLLSLKQYDNDIDQLRNYAETHQVPIVDQLSLDLIQQIIRLHQPKEILEVGSAIGYSAMQFASVDKSINVTTIERNEEMIQQAKTNIRKLQPTAKLIRTVNAEVNIDEVLETGRFNFEAASQSAGWLQELEAGGHATHTPETEEYGISSFVYRRRLPFHAERFNAFLENMSESIVRAKGIAWLAQYNDVACLVSQAGTAVDIHPVTFWVASMPKAERAAILQERPDVRADWDPEYGDRHTQLVIIGIDLDEAAITAELDECLLNSQEIDAEWSQLFDPYGWEIRRQEA